MSAPELRTPSEWSVLDGVTVMDPDGWRGSRTLPAKSFDEPINRAEWEERLSVSSQISPVKAEAFSVVDRIALRLMRTQIYGTSPSQRWDESARQRWAKLYDEEREDYRTVARALLADIASGDTNRLRALSEYKVRAVDGREWDGWEDIGDAVDFADREGPDSKVFQRTNVIVRSEWTEVTA